MTDKKIIPNLFIVLQADENELLKRVTNRRIDPVSGETYHLINNPPKDEHVRKRLICRIGDTKELFLARLKRYKERHEPVISFYEKMDLVRRIDAGKSMEEVFAECCKAIEEVINKR